MLTQNNWGVQPIPARWRQCTNGTGNTVYYNKSVNQWAPSYKAIFEQTMNEEEKLTQKASNSCLQESSQKLADYAPHRN
jgi:hypothetical protein